MKLEKKKYKKILSLKKKFNFNEFDLITNYDLFSGDTNLYKTLKIYDLIKNVENVKGDIIELGIFQGNLSLLIKKILYIFKIKKKLYLLDHFKGLITFSAKDTKESLKFKKKYEGKKNQIKSFLNFYKFRNVKFLDKDATKLIPGFFLKKIFSLAYFDMDLYEPTYRALLAIEKNIAINGLIVFDQGNKKKWAERYAIKDFLKNKKNYKKIIINKIYQPDIILKKIA